MTSILRGFATVASLPVIIGFEFALAVANHVTAAPTLPPVGWLDEHPQR